VVVEANDKDEIDEFQENLAVDPQQNTRVC